VALAVLSLSLRDPAAADAALAPLTALVERDWPSLSGDVPG
jgi:hypothetical protein